MVIPIITLVAIPIFLGIVVASPFDPPEEPKNEIISKEPNDNILYFVLIVIWTIVFTRILLQIKKGTFKATQKY
jgi:hypothetical protein